MEKITVVKIGGNVIDDPAVLKRFIADFAAMPGPKILVHGGGKVATRLAERLELKVQMVDGRRITDKGSTALSCTLEFSPMVKVPSSPRSTAPYHTVEPAFRITSPCTVALGATNAAPSLRGTFPQKDRNIVKNRLSLFLFWLVYGIL